MTGGTVPDTIKEIKYKKINMEFIKNIYNCWKRLNKKIVFSNHLKTHKRINESMLEWLFWSKENKETSLKS